MTQQRTPRAHDGRRLVGPGPWHVQPDGKGIACNGSWGFDVAEWERLRPVPRPILELVCSCVNACEGINPEAVSYLVEALEEIAAFPDSEYETDRIMRFRWNTVEAARAALAKAKGGAA